MAEEISSQPNINSIVWLLVATVVQIYNEKCGVVDHERKLGKVKLKA